MLDVVDEAAATSTIPSKSSITGEFHARVFQRAPKLILTTYSGNLSLSENDQCGKGPGKIRTALGREFRPVAQTTWEHARPHLPGSYQD